MIKEKKSISKYWEKTQINPKKNVNSTNSLFRIWYLNNLTKRKAEQTTKLKVNIPISNLKNLKNQFVTKNLKKLNLNQYNIQNQWLQSWAQNYLVEGKHEEIMK